MAYARTEQETFLRYDAEDRAWYLETNVYHHIERYLADDILVPETIEKEMEDGRVIGLRGRVNTDNFRVGIRKIVRREYTEEEKQLLRERLAKARNLPSTDDRKEEL